MVTPVIEPKFKNLEGAFISASTFLDKDTERAIRVLGSRWVQITKTEVPVRGGGLRDSIRYEPFASQSEFGFAGMSAQPLGSYVKLGTKPHRIRARNALALHFFWQKVGLDVVVPRKGGFKTHRKGNTLYIGKGFVNHPGTKPNAYHLRAFEKFWPEVQDQVRQVSERFVLRLAGEANE